MTLHLSRAALTWHKADKNSAEHATYVHNGTAYPTREEWARAVQDARNPFVLGNETHCACVGDE